MASAFWSPEVGPDWVAKWQRLSSSSARLYIFAVAHAYNIRDDAAINAMIDAIWADGGALTGVVNNAAGNFISRTEDLSVNGFNAIADIVFRGTFYVTHDVGTRIIKEKGRCNFLSILTTWVWNGSAFVVPSAMSKAATTCVSTPLRQDCSRPRE